MIEISTKTTAVLRLKQGAHPGLHHLAPVLGPALGQLDASIRRIDVALGGETLDYYTDLGLIEIRCRYRSDGLKEVCVSCDTLRIGDRNTGRQICYQLTRRLISRFDVASVLWWPTRQRLEADRFSWARLADLPQRFAASFVSMKALSEIEASA